MKHIFLLEDDETLGRGIAMALTGPEASVTVPAGGSLTLTASLTKAASHDFAGGGGETGLRGYDLVTTLGSNLRFTRQQAVIEDRGLVEIAEQNLGFDLAAGAAEVSLDLTQAHWYLEIRPRD